MKTLLKLFAAGAILLSSCQETTPPPPGGDDALINTDPTELTFNALANEDALVTVASPDPDWTPSVTVDWLNVEKESANTLKVTAADVTAKEDRETDIALTTTDGKTHLLHVKQWGLNTVTTLALLNGETDMLLAPRNGNAQISFLPDPLLPRVIKVDLTKASSFTMEGSADWLDIKRDGNQITLTTAPYDQTIDRKTDLTFTAGVGDERRSVVLTVMQKGSGPHFETMLSGNIPAGNVSGNGRYVVGTLSGASWVMDRANETFYRVGSGRGQVNEADPSVGAITLSGISNDGVASGTGVRDATSGAMLPLLFNLKTQSFTWLPTNIVSPERPGVPVSSGCAWDISADGRTAVGYVLIPPGADEEEEGGTLEAVLNVRIRYYPVMWRDGVATPMGYLPEGFKTDKHHGYIAKTISSDGSRATGYLDDRFGHRIGCTWDLANPTADPEFILYDNPDYFALSKNTFHYGKTPDESTWETVDIDLPYLFVTPQDISADGRYISLTLNELVQPTNRYYPVAYDAVNKSVTFRGKNADALAGFFMPDGRMSYAVPHGGEAGRTTYFADSASELTMPDYMREVYSLSTPLEDAAGAATSFTLRAISDDGKVIVGYNSSTGYTTTIVSL